MPSHRPSAAFDPLPPDLDLAALVEETPSFEYVTRVSCDMIDSQGMEQFERLVLLHVILGGKPLVVEGFQHRLDEWTFTSQWLRDNAGSKFENARNLQKQQFLPLSIGHYLNNLSKLTNQWTSTNYRDTDRQRIYLKDIDCPALWQEKLEEHTPPGLFYLNESTGEYGGPGAPDIEPTKKSNHTKGRGIAHAGDLMSSLPPHMRADNLMCYIGHEGTYTPAHREMCASLGQNLMVETSGNVDEEGKPAKPGSSIWFMTETNDRHLVSEYWLSTLGHDIEVEKHFAQINAWKAAPFTTYIVEQKAGDFILIPPLAAHQVWNRGTRTMKVAWNRTTVETVELALHEALPRARMVCRDEQYKIKAIIYFTLQKYSDLLNRIETLKQTETNAQGVLDLSYNSRIRQLQKDFRRLFGLYTETLLSEMLAPVAPNEKKGQYLPYDSFVTCSYCRCNIFNRFLTCESCIEPLENGEENTYDICMDCFAMGRSCKCISNFKWVEQFPWQELTERHEQWRHQVISLDGGLNEKSPRSLQRERKSLGRKTLAQICQEQLKVRPWNDPKNPTPVLTTSEMDRMRSGREDPDDEDDETPNKRSKKKGPGKLKPGFVTEHVGCHTREAWKCAKCAKCDRAYQYGSLWRMFDMMPQSVMEQYEWECPACQKFCSCGACRRKADNIAYEPRGTVLGHDTKKVADPRSTESLVDFSMSNLHHINKIGDDDPLESRRIGRHLDEAARAKAQDPELGDNYVGEEDVAVTAVAEQFYENGIRYTTEPDIPIDPMLSIAQPSEPTTRKRNPLAEPARKSAASETNGEGVRLQKSTKKKGQQKQGIDQSSAQQRNEDTVYGSGNNLRSPTGIAPTAAMASNDGEHLNGHSGTMDASYQYPEPSMGDAVDPSYYPDVNGSVNGRMSVAEMLQVERNAHDDNVTQYQQAQIKSALQEAKRSNRYIVAEAALTGKSLPVALPVGRLGLALMADRTTATPNSPSTIAPKTHNIDKELLQSDLPAVDRNAKPVGQVKKRKVRDGEPDDEFGVKKRKERKHYIAQTVRKERKRPREEEVEVSSDSDVAEESFVTVSKRSRGPRRLPKYLADQHEDGDFPTELPQDTSRRRQRQGEKHRSSIGGRTISSARGKEPETTAFTSAETIADENRKAKQKAVQWANRDADDSSDSDQGGTSGPLASESVLGKATDSAMKIPQSVFSRMAGRKIKISGAKPKMGTVNGAARVAKV